MPLVIEYHARAMGYPWPWVSDPRRNFLTDENLPQVHAALARGSVVLEQMHFCGGCSHTVYLLRNEADLGAVLAKARPGDWLVAWSVADLIELGLPLVHHRVSILGGVVPVADLGVAHDHLQNPYSEIIVCSLAREPTAFWCDIDGWDDVLDAARRCDQVGDEFTVFRAADLEDAQQELVAAKYPNEMGETPVGGAY